MVGCDKPSPPREHVKLTKEFKVYLLQLVDNSTKIVVIEHSWDVTMSPENGPIGYLTEYRRVVLSNGDILALRDAIATSSNVPKTNFTTSICHPHHTIRFYSGASAETLTEMSVALRTNTISGGVNGAKFYSLLPPCDFSTKLARVLEQLGFEIDASVIEGRKAQPKSSTSFDDNL
jgi:hypothetical protein